MDALYDVRIDVQALGVSRRRILSDGALTRRMDAAQEAAAKPRTQYFLPELRPSGRYLVRWITADGRLRWARFETQGDAIHFIKRSAGRGRFDPTEWKATKLRAALRPSVRFTVLTRDAFRCVYCGARAPDVRLMVDHAISILDGGTDDEANLVTACEECNLGKGSRSVPHAVDAFHNLGPGGRHATLRHVTDD